MSLPSLDHAAKKRALENALSGCINVLHTLKHQTNLTIEQKFKIVEELQKALPVVRRLLIYFNTVEKGL
jgi:hypothetical protein